MNPNGRPRKTIEEKGVQISIRLPKELLDRVEAAVKKSYSTRSIFIRQAIAEYFERIDNASDLATEYIKSKHR